MKTTKNKKKQEKAFALNQEAVLKQLLQLSLSEEFKTQNAALTTIFKPLNYAHANSFQQKLTQLLAHTNFSLEQSIISYKNMYRVLRQAQIISPIIDSLFRAYCSRWKKNQIKLLQIWRSVPSHLFQSFLKQFQLLYMFKSLNSTIFLKQLRIQLFQGRTALVCEQLRLYLPQERQTNQNKEVKQFLQNQLVLRIINSQQLFSDGVLNLLKANRTMAEIVLKKIDYAQGVRVANKIDLPIDQIPFLHRYVLYKHYRSVVHQLKWWYFVEDKVSFSPIFIQFLIQDLQKLQKQGQNEDSIKVQPTINIKVLINSLCKRHNLKIRQPLIEQQIVNPLDQMDAFCSTSIILEKYEHSKRKPSIQLQALNIKQANEILQKDENEYIQLQALNIKQQNVIWIDSLGQAFDQMRARILTEEEVGFDTEFRCIQTKQEQQGVAVIQLGTRTHCYLLDYLRLQSLPPVQSFLQQLIQGQQPKKVGHTLGSDLKFLRYKSTKSNSQNSEEGAFKARGLIDLAKEYKALYPGDRYSSLAYLAQKFLGKKLCKYEQRSNWNRRPLRRRQVHYAAMDAISCLHIYACLRKGSVQCREIFVANKQRHPTFDVLVDFLKRQQPHKFLVDNMLKKLCSQLRNSGVDAEYVGERDYNVVVQQALKEQRAVITRDFKLHQRKHSVAPIYLVQEKCDSEAMFAEVVAAFQIKLQDYQTLSRCVKCNGADLVVIPKEEALNQLHFKHGESQIEQFWRCIRCRQLYWEGGQWRKAKKKYAHLAQSLHDDA